MQEWKVRVTAPSPVLSTHTHALPFSFLHLSQVSPGSLHQRGELGLGRGSSVWGYLVLTATCMCLIGLSGT